MGLLSKKDAKLILDPLSDNNPITIQVLGICSALAITVQLKPAIVMALSVLVVLSVANVIEEVFHIINPKSLIDRCIELSFIMNSALRSTASPFPLFANNERLEVSVINTLRSYAMSNDKPRGEVYKLPFSII